MIKVKLMGGLGNQMFQYAILRANMLKYKTDGIISLDGITSQGHSIFSLDNFNISKDVKVSSEKCSSFGTFLLKVYERYLNKLPFAFALVRIMNFFTSIFGLIFIPDGYLKVRPCFKNNIRLIGYFQSEKYFYEYKDIIKKELKVTQPMLDINKKIYQEINSSNSVCIHIRRGDYVNSMHQICNLEYFKKAVDIMKNKINNPVFFVFSDDAKWVKENLKIDGKVIYVDNNNPNYEDLRLMYSCKNFIISNSSYSWWAQYLSENEDKVVIAPSKWFQNKNVKCDIFMDNWLKL